MWKFTFEECIIHFFKKIIFQYMTASHRADSRKLVPGWPRPPACSGDEWGWVLVRAPRRRPLIPHWAEWLRNRRVELLDHSLLRSLLRSHHSLIRYAQHCSLRSRSPLCSFARSFAFIRLLARWLAHSGAHGKQVFVYESNASISYRVHNPNWPLRERCNSALVNEKTFQK